jgi:hypothetical protein
MGEISKSVGIILLSKWAIPHSVGCILLTSYGRDTSVIRLYPTD